MMFYSTSEVKFSVTCYCEKNITRYASSELTIQNINLCGLLFMSVNLNPDGLHVERHLHGNRIQETNSQVDNM